jgi:RHS repeat-associated protein
VTHTDYNSQGIAYQVTDPRGIVTVSSFDLAGRVTQTISGATSGYSPTNTTNQTTNYTYDGDDHILTMQAVMPSGTPSQTTQYVYGVGTTAGTDLFSNDLIAKVEYPTKTGGSAGQPSTAAADDQSYAYNFLGDTKTYTDQNGTVHTYTYDPLGRMTLDSVTSGSVKSLGYAFDTAGRLFTATSYSDSAGTAAVNQVERLYNGLGQTTDEYQAHSGTVTVGTSPDVHYAYSDPATGSRLTAMTYPNGRVLGYGYGGTAAVTGLSESGTTVTATTATPHGLLPGSSVTISGASPSGYDGTFTVAAVNSPTTFTYTAASGLGTSSGTDITASAKPASMSVSSLSYSGTTITATVSSTASLANNEMVTIAGATPAIYDGSFKITVTDSTHFTYSVATTPSASATGTITASPLTLDSSIGRLSALYDPSAVWGLDSAGQVLESYDYLGLSAIAQRNRPQTKVALSYIQQNGDTLAGTDGGDRYTGLDRFGRVSDQNWVNPSIVTSTDRYQYGYDAGSNVLYKNNLVNSSFSELYHANSTGSGDNASAYDKLNRLQAFRRGTLSSSGHNGSGLDTVATLNTNAQSSESYSLDAQGNMTGVVTDGTGTANTFNSRNQETAASGSTITNDNVGNIISDPLDGAWGSEGFTYDAWGHRLVDAGCTTTIAYDALGRRTIDTTTDAFSCGTSTSKQHDLYYDSAGQVIQDDASWTSSGCGCGCSTTHLDSQQYVWGQGYVNDLVLRDRQVDASTNSRLYVQQDANYNVTAITDSLGNVQERLVYDPWGREQTFDAGYGSCGVSSLVASHTSPDTDSNAWIIGFQGGRFDTGTGLYGFGARDYSVNLMRWVEADPTGAWYVDGANLYQMELSNPLERVDPLGLATVTGTVTMTALAPDTPEAKKIAEKELTGTDHVDFSLDINWEKYTENGKCKVKHAQVVDDSIKITNEKNAEKLLSALSPVNPKNEVTIHSVTIDYEKDNQEAVVNVQVEWNFSVSIPAEKAQDLLGKASTKFKSLFKYGKKIEIRTDKDSKILIGRREIHYRIKCGTIEPEVDEPKGRAPESKTK